MRPPVQLNLAARADIGFRPPPNTTARKDPPANTPPPIPRPDVSRFRKHLTRYEIDENLHQTYGNPNVTFLAHGPDEAPRQSRGAS